jgi:hypothetical protein
MGVSIGPGMMVLTRMRRAASSRGKRETERAQGGFGRTVGAHPRQTHNRAHGRSENNRPAVRHDCDRMLEQEVGPSHVDAEKLIEVRFVSRGKWRDARDPCVDKKNVDAPYNTYNRTVQHYATHYAVMG